MSPKNFRRPLVARDLGGGSSGYGCEAGRDIRPKLFHKHPAYTLYRNDLLELVFHVYAAVPTDQGAGYRLCGSARDTRAGPQSG